MYNTYCNYLIYMGVPVKKYMLIFLSIIPLTNYAARKPAPPELKAPGAPRKNTQLVTKFSWQVLKIERDKDESEEGKRKRIQDLFKTVTDCIIKKSSSARSDVIDDLIEVRKRSLKRLQNLSSNCRKNLFNNDSDDVDPDNSDNNGEDFDYPLLQSD